MERTGWGKSVVYFLATRLLRDLGLGPTILISPLLSLMRDPLLLMVAGADFTPLEEFQRFDRELSEAGVPHRMVVYDGAPHSFFDRTFKEHEEAAADSWRQMLDFVKQNTAAV